MNDLTFDPYHHFAFLTNRVGRLLAAGFEEECKAHGYDFSSSCIGILADLWQQDGVPQKSLAMNLVKNKSSITKMLDALESHELVTRVEDPNDRRIKLIHLTDKGIAFEQFVATCSNKHELSSTTSLTQEEINTAKKVLTTMYKELISQSKNISSITKSKTIV